MSSPVEDEVVKTAKKWDGWKTYEERPLIIRAIQVIQDNLTSIIEAVNNVPGCTFQSFDGKMLLVRIQGDDMFHARKGEYIRAVARKLERMDQENFEELYELRCSKRELLRRIQKLEDK